MKHYAVVDNRTYRLVNIHDTLESAIAQVMRLDSVNYISVHTTLNDVVTHVQGTNHSAVIYGGDSDGNV